MGKFRVKYLHQRSYKGQKLLYWYPNKEYLIDGKWVKCPFKGKQVASIAEAEALNDALDKWRSGNEQTKRHYEHGTVGWIIGQYRKSEAFKGLAPNTKKLYGWHFPEIERVFGDRPATVITRQHAKAFYHSFEGMPHKASKMVQVARVVMAYGKDIGIVTDNPFESLGVNKAPSREAVWTTEMLETAKQAAHDLKMPSIALAIQLGIDTGQRPGDLRLLTWNRYNGLTIKLRQTKTKVWVEVPVMPELKKMLDKASKESPVMLITEATGKPYSKDMLSRRIRDVLTKAKIGRDIQFRDLRRTAVVRLAEHGCEIPEICAITGHSLADATAILEVYLPRNSKMAANAIAKLQKSKES
jgi:integrase